MVRSRRERALEAQRIERLAAVPLFDGVSKRGLQKIADMASEKTFAPGEELTTETTKGGRFHLIIEGSARVLVHGRPRSMVGPGAAIGEIALIDGGPRSATVVADTEVRTLSLASWNFRSLLREEPTIAEKVMVGLAQRVRTLEEAIDSLSAGKG